MEVAYGSASDGNSVFWVPLLNFLVNLVITELISIFNGVLLNKQQALLIHVVDVIGHSYTVTDKHL